jgi:hypothetical protein
MRRTCVKYRLRFLPNSLCSQVVPFEVIVCMKRYECLPQINLFYCSIWIDSGYLDFRTGYFRAIIRAIIPA